MSDPTTQSNYTQIASENVAFDWTVDFQARVIHGSASHKLRVKEDGVKEIIFDTADLDISAVQVAGKPVESKIKPKHEVMGSALHIALPEGLEVGGLIDVTVNYSTTKACTALQWLEKEQTQGKKFPYLFSQCQPIYARALAPLQDTPSVKITYTAKVSSVLPVLLSAIRVSPPSDGPAHDGKTIGKDSVSYTYNQPVPIPSYLIAIAAGNVCYRPFPKYEDKEWTTGIWAEPELIDKAYWEFSEDTARFLAAEEKIVASYKFGVYDLLVLPPSFPYGGMENACLTFLTPTLLTGDRTLVDVVVHELTHSFFGNGVTHAHASHFWLNEGWTTYIERVLQQVLHSPADRGFSFLIGEKALKDSLKQYDDRPKYQRLVIEFEKGEDPDDAYSSIPYEKGANFILHLERTLGGLDVFLPYVKDYVNTFMGKSITTEQWKAHLYGYWEKHGGPEKIKTLDSVDWNAWLYGEGHELPVKMKYDMTLAEKAYDLAARWDAARTSDIAQLDFKETDLDDFNGNQIIVFLERLDSLPPLPSSLIFHLGSLYRLSSSSNAEVRSRFYEIALGQPSSEVAKAFASEAAKWVIGDDESGVVKGRMKFCRPIFRAIGKVDKELALKTFSKSKTAFHPIARKLIEKDLGAL
ncbi:peptidase family M1-domain-containing protein [Crucibulum laeve]|uniref:Peptidase family M1-domain-containing protein n=1 Tax=Crucibulum laeve TaxID=68775 RepID=A0A5C3M1N4_9AGAR|nr:peptidase family M1-domain-containing protein [Crucibulum laeve]